VVGWAYWSYKQFDDPTTVAGDLKEGLFLDDGSYQETKLKELARTSLQATQGHLTSQYFNSTNSTYVASFILDLSITRPSLLYISYDFHHTSPLLLTLTLLSGEEEQQLTEYVDYKVKWEDENNYKSNHMKLIIVNEELDGSLLEIKIENSESKEKEFL